MRIYIPTKGRVDRQITMERLPVELLEQVTIVCPSYEADAHTSNHPLSGVVIQPDDEMGIAMKRKWIIDNTPHERIVMLDDDLTFSVRRDDDPGKFRRAEDEDLIKAFFELEAILCEEFPHAGFGARGGSIGSAAKRGGWQEGKRMMYVLGYHIPTVRKHAVFGRLASHEDMDVCLQLLTKGFPNYVNQTVVVDQKFGAPGGCTNERSIEDANVDSLVFQKLFPDYVRVEYREYTSSEPRIEIVCSWQKALEDGLLKKDKQ